MHVSQGVAQQSQMEAGHRGNWSAARDAGHRPLAGDFHYRPASTLLDFPRKCLFLSVPRWEVALLLISSLFIKGAPEVSKHTSKTEWGWAVEREQRWSWERENICENKLVAAWFSSLVRRKGGDDTKRGKNLEWPLRPLWLPQCTTCRPPMGRGGFISGYMSARLWKEQTIFTRPFSSEVTFVG